MYATARLQAPLAGLEPFRSLLAKNAERPAGGDPQVLAAWQQVCPVTGNKLGSMGPPVQAAVEQMPVMLCCPACEDPLHEKPEYYLTRLSATSEAGVLAVPERAVIDTGEQQVVYVEREPGLFEGVEVKLGPRANGFYPVIAGLLPGDRVATAGAFLLDAETRLNPAVATAFFGARGGPHSGEPSAAPRTPGKTDRRETPSARQKQPTPKDQANVNKLPDDDRLQALQQVFCPITERPLGWMGVPVKATAGGAEIFLCCKGCESEFQKSPQEALERLAELKR
jgi:hypothetical protein